MSLRNMADDAMTVWPPRQKQPSGRQKIASQRQHSSTKENRGTPSRGTPNRGQNIIRRLGTTHGLHSKKSAEPARRDDLSKRADTVTTDGILPHMQILDFDRGALAGAGDLRPAGGGLRPGRQPGAPNIQPLVPPGMQSERHSSRNYWHGKRRAGSGANFRGKTIRAILISFPCPAFCRCKSGGSRNPSCSGFRLWDGR